MSKKLYEEDDIQNIANSIRGKNGETTKYKVSDMSTAIDNIPSGSGDKYTPEFISFYGYTGTSLVNAFKNIDTSNITSMSYMFQNCSSLTSLDLSNFDTSNVTNMLYMFQNCRSLTSIDFSSLNTSNALYMSYMFQNCSSLTSLDLSNFDTSKVTLMQNMFDGCSSLTSLDLSSFIIAGSGNTGYLSGMFANCSSLTSINLSSFGYTQYAYDISSMFYNCRSLTSIDLSNFIPVGVSSCSNMFYGCTSLKEVNLASMTGMGKKTTSITLQDVRYMFYNCSSLEKIDIRNLDFTKVTYYYSYMLNNVPTTCEIIVNQSGYDFFTSKFPSYTNLTLIS